MSVTNSAQSEICKHCQIPKCLDYKKGIILHILGKKITL